MLTVVCLLVFGMLANGATSPPTKPLPSLTGDMVVDLIAVARSQAGYKGTKDAEGNLYSAYSDWAGTTGSRWCSEFVAWCMRHAKVPESIVPACDSSEHYLYYFGEMGRYYIVDNGQDHGDDSCVAQSAKTIKVSEICAGDILLSTSSSTLKQYGYTYGISHAAIVTAVGKDGSIYTVEGNLENCVKEKRRDPAYVKNNVHGVCRPAYPASKKGPAISLSLTSKTLYLGVEYKYRNCKLFPAVTGGAGTVSYSSSKSSVAKVSKDGTVVARKTGKAVITASAVVNGKKVKATCTIKVKKPSLSVKKTLKIPVGTTVQINPKTTPAGKATYSVKKKKICSVASDGTVTAKKKGKTKITVRYGTAKKTIKVKVY